MIKFSCLSKLLILFVTILKPNELLFTGNETGPSALKQTYIPYWKRKGNCVVKKMITLLYIYVVCLGIRMVFIGEKRRVAALLFQSCSFIQLMKCNITCSAWRIPILSVASTSRGQIVKIW